VSYIDKNSNIVVSARMTNEGRRLLSLGLLTFDTFRLGDSNIDYSTLGSSYDITLENIIRAKAENPDLKTPLLPTATATDTYVTIPTLNPVILEQLITAPKVGFFDYGTGGTITYTAYTDTVCHILQSDTIIPLAGLTGGTSIPIRQSGSYGSNTYEPKIGDLMMVKMSNDELALTQTPTVVDLNVPVPYLWFQVQAVQSGSLTGDDLQIQIDRNFASFPSYGGANEAQVIFYPLGTGGTQNSLFSDGGFFSGGCVWNMNNVWSYPIPGVDDSTHETFNKYGSETYIGSKEYFGYTSEIGLLYTANTACNLIPSISIIHYTNKETCDNQSEQKYGQKFYVDTTTQDTPELILPTLMWHKDYSGNTIGHTFMTTGDTKFVTLSGVNTTVYYHDLVDKYGNAVGRTYPELHMFTIDNQELVAAMSYKSNRNWTLPTIITTLGSTVDGVIDGTETLYVTYMLESTSGYTSGLHCQNTVCVNFDTQDCKCNPIDAKTVELTLPNEFPFMKVSGGTGWYADRFYALVQKQTIGTYPDPTAWVMIDFTSDIVGHTVGQRINPANLANSTFEVTATNYASATPYDLNDYIKIPGIAETEYLQFGDERFLYGNIESTGVTNKYRTKFVFTVPPTQFNWSTNPTWSNSNQYTHINEVCVYDVNKTLVAIGKMNLPIEKVPNATIIIEIAFDL
jgi:hypothetical protein